MQNITISYPDPPRGEIIAAAQFANPKDWHLRRVMAREGEQYFVWTHNVLSGEYFWGHYGLSRGEAFALFAEKMRADTDTAFPKAIAIERKFPLVEEGTYPAEEGESQ